MTEMFDVMNGTYPEFSSNGIGGYRTLKQFLDDNQKRANCYVPSKANQDKQDWQANAFMPTTRNKVKALLASVVKTPPEVAMVAINENNELSALRAEVMKTMVDSSYFESEGNPETEIFFDGWNNCINGTVIKLDDYLKIKNKVKIITDYDPTTGEVKYDEEEVLVEDRPIEVDIPIPNFLIKDQNIRDVQNQTAVVWVDYKSKEEVDYEFGHYPNTKFIKQGIELSTEGDTELFFGNEWQNRTDEDKYEIARYYNKAKDIFRILINGVIIFDGPLLWGRKKKKYPFSKTIFEPFANSKFFWGNSLPNILMAEQDIENAFINSLTDKTYRSLMKPMLIGRVNQDSFDLEDDVIEGQDDKIYVDDVKQVVPMDFEGATNAEITMLKIIQGGLDQDSSDQVQGGASGSGSTAREIVIANERAEELKGLVFTFMKDLWLQKYRLRTINLLMHYSIANVEQVLDEDGQEFYNKNFKKFRIDNVELADGRMGTKEIQVVENESKLKRPFELDLMEERSRLEGQPTEVLQVTSSALDDFDYIVQIKTESLRQKSKALQLAKTQEKVIGVANMFPEIFMANKRKFFEDYIESYGDNADKYQESQPQGMPGIPGLEGMEGGEQAGTPVAAGGLPQLAM